MKAYLVTTGTIFGLIVVAHVVRIVAENPSLATDPWFLALTVAAGGLSGWAGVLLRRASRTGGGSSGSRTGGDPR